MNYPDVDAYIQFLNEGYDNGISSTNPSSDAKGGGSDVADSELYTQEAASPADWEFYYNMLGDSDNLNGSDSAERADSGDSNVDRSEPRRDTRSTDSRKIGIECTDYGVYPSITGADHLTEKGLDGDDIIGSDDWVDWSIPWVEPCTKPSQRQVGGTHYKKYKIQPAEYCQKNKLNHLESAVVKYVTRHSDKGGIEDIDKAIECLELIKEWEYGHYD